MSENHPVGKEGAQPIRQLADEALHNLIHFDRKVFQVIPELLFDPGPLAGRTLKGEKIYVRPFALFVFINFVFFVLKNPGLFHYTLDGYGEAFADRVVAASKEMNLSVELLRERFNTAMKFEQKGYMVMMVPLFAILMQVAFITRRRHYVEYVILALYFYSAEIILLIVLPYVAEVITWIPGTTHFVQSEGFLMGALLLFPFLWLYSLSRYLFKENRMVTAIKAAVLSYCSVLLIVYVYRTVLFFVTLHAIK